MTTGVIVQIVSLVLSQITASRVTVALSSVRPLLMATVAHHIRSDYDPADRERLEEETGQIPIDEEEQWNTAPTFSAARRAPPPSFVPARIQYDEWGSAISLTHAESLNAPAPDSRTSEWYRALTRDSSGNQPPARPSSTPTSEAPKLKKEATTKNNWFIKRALQSEPTSKPSSPAPSLADLLARDPPPLPSEERFVPPVWLAIGPSNKGFNLLQKRGWNEGEGLGAHVARSRRPRSPAHMFNDAEPISHAPSLRGTSMPAGDQKSRDILLPDVVIDLTQSESEDEDDLESFHQSPFLPSTTSDPHSQKSLLTPIPTILKSDRLGIGLKAKTEGPYKQSRKRVTHNQAALASHIRAAEELRRKRAEVGRGRRGFAKVRKREENERKHMLAYLNE
ncbi:hypothetical protein DEU56DRAFT_496438 [Suillus clintonianus]|uniref:uncharacterized protein n=1 Tax=Suillus clintonianus TaxID=1904413 RepID=UPI001B866617|nr:uncharacterized protein DEU56DRAFT_496438 [Suillus clintonianus]KAG2129493.1 hypothetical protein DEU56DRAFT_496438 [Suillus clintonianus]